jgi:hypothetical protein
LCENLTLFQKKHCQIQHFPRRRQWKFAEKFRECTGFVETGTRRPIQQEIWVLGKYEERSAATEGFVEQRQPKAAIYAKVSGQIENAQFWNRVKLIEYKFQDVATAPFFVYEQ